MAENVAPMMPSAEYIAPLQMVRLGRGRRVRDRIRPHRLHRRLTRLSRTARLRPESIAEMQTFSGRSIDVPCQFIGGRAIGASIKRRAR